MDIDSELRMRLDRWRFLPAAPVEPEPVAEDNELTPQEVAALVTTADGTGRCGFGRAHIGITYREITAGQGELAAAFGGYLGRVGALSRAGVGAIITGGDARRRSGLLALLAEGVCRQAGSWHEPPAEAERVRERPLRPRIWRVTAAGLAGRLMMADISEPAEFWHSSLQLVRHLIIDGLGGGEQLDGAAVNLLYELIERRHERLLPTSVSVCAAECQHGGHVIGLLKDHSITLQLDAQANSQQVLAVEDRQPTLSLHG